MQVEIESYSEFVKRHSTPEDPPVDDGHSLHLRFWDGASANADESKIRTEPSPSEALRLRAMIQYRVIRRDRAEKAFQTARSHYSQACVNAHKFANLPVPDESAIDHLNALRDEYALQCQKLADLKQQYDATDMAIAEREREEQRRQKTVAIAHIHEQINSMTLYEGEVRKTFLQQATEDLHRECDKIASDRLERATGMPRKEVEEFVKNNRAVVRRM